MKGQEIRHGKRPDSCELFRVDVESCDDDRLRALCAAQLAARRSSDRATNLAIDVGGVAVGSVGFELHQDVERVSAEIGYWLGQPYWGRGIMSAAVRGATVYAMQKFALTRIYALPFATNAASARVLEKAGYTLEGRLRRSAIKEDVVMDQLMYAITDQDLT